jgi:hypothetical protein
MRSKKRLSVMFILGMSAIAVLMFAGLPFTQFSVTNVQAQYVPSAESGCGAAVNYQVRLYGDTGFFADAALNQLAGVIQTTTPAQRLQKYLICTDSLTDPTAVSWRIWLANNIVFIPANSGQIVPRAFADNQ